MFSSCSPSTSAGTRRPDGSARITRWVFVVLRDVQAARTAAKSKWTGDDPRPHVNAVRELEVIDGFSKSLEPTDLAEAPVIDPAYVAWTRV